MFIQGWGYFSTKSPLLLTRLFHLWEDPMCHSSKILCWSVEALHACSVLVCHLQNDILRVHSSGDRKGRNWRVINRDCRVDEREQSTPSLQLTFVVHRPICGLVLSCRRSTWFSFLFGWTLQIRSCTLFNICTYDSELTVLSPRIPLTRFLRCRRSF